MHATSRQRQAKNAAVIQLHLKKLFAGIHTVLFEEGEDEDEDRDEESDDRRPREAACASIVAMRSIAGETVPMLMRTHGPAGGGGGHVAPAQSLAVEITDAVESWLDVLATRMRLTLRSSLEDALASPTVREGG